MFLGMLNQLRVELMALAELAGLNGEPGPGLQGGSLQNEVIREADQEY
jgi:hypothetical protein